MENIIKKNIDFYSKKIKIELRKRLFDLSPNFLECPIFIIGCSRSGTTLVYKTFSESTNLGTRNKETHDFWSTLHPIEEINWSSHEINEACATDADRLTVSRFFYSQTGKLKIVDKNNQNGLSVKYLYRLFPDSHFIYVKRNPGDNIDSLITGWRKPVEFGTWSNKIPLKISIDNGMFDKWCFFLPKGWQSFTNATIEKVCAFQYKSINESILQAKVLIPTKQWHEVFYEDIISCPTEVFRNLFNNCDLPFDRRIERHCNNILNTPYNIFSPIGVEKWRNSINSQKVSRILDDVSEIKQAMGYSDSYID